MNWHEFYALLLSGRPVVDWSDAGAWATYDVASGGWSADRIVETEIDARWLPDICRKTNSWRPEDRTLTRVTRSISVL